MAEIAATLDIVKVLLGILIAVGSAGGGLLFFIIRKDLDKLKSDLRLNIKQAENGLEDKMEPKFSSVYKHIANHETRITVLEKSAERR